MGGFGEGMGICPAVVPVLVGPLQVLLTLRPGLLVALAGGLLGLFKPSGLKNAVRLLWRQKIAAGVLAVVGLGLYFGAKQLWPRGEAGVVTSAQQGRDWPTARGDLTRCGAVADSGSPTRAQLIWSKRPGDEGVFASPAVVGNRVYISSAQLGISNSGAIHCLAAETGAVVWTTRPPDYRPTFSSPVIAGDYVVCGEGLHDTRDARVVCLDREQGNVLWTFRTNNHVECTPVVANGRVYVGAGDDGVYCLDLKPGPDGQAQVRWHKPPAQFPDAETSLAVYDGKVYVGLGNDGAALVVLDAATGDELHRLKMPYPVFSPPAIADGKLYLGMGNGDYVKAGEGGAVACINLKTFKTEWTFELPQTVLGAVAVKDDRLYFGCSDGQVYCLSRTGQLVKQYNASAPIKTSPAVTETHVYIVTDGGLLFALDRTSLEPVWQFRLGTDGLFISSPVVARGHVYVGTQSEGLLCVGKPASSKRTPLWAAPLGGPGVAGNSDNSPIPESGEIHWLNPPAQGKSSDADSIGAAVAVWDDHLYVARSGNRHRGLECLELTKESRDPPRLVWKLATEGDVERSPVLLGRTVACVDGRRESGRLHVSFVDRSTGALLAATTLPPNASGVLSATRHEFLVQDEISRLSSFDEQGIKRWSAVVGRLAHAPAANDALILAVAIQPPHAVALDRATGAELWRAPLEYAPTAAAVLEKNSFLLATQDGLEARTLIDGKTLTSWKAEMGVPTGELAVRDSLVLCVNQRGELIVLDRTDGKVTARVSGALAGQTPLVSRGKVIYAATDRLMIFTLGQIDPAPELWLDLSTALPTPLLGKGLRMTASSIGPLVLNNSRLFTVLPGRGLACLGGAK